ncbi:MAG: AAA family ATPase [Planctomycetaceae bacterium]|nr:AAA family ATPase [Planctomycetaceae bacterium]
MRIDEIRLKNFRKFEDAAISFHPEFNLLVGENGSGKTAILEVIMGVSHSSMCASR